MVYYVENLLNLIDDIVDSTKFVANLSYLRGELTAFYLMGYIARDEYVYYNSMLLNKEGENEKN